MMIMFANNTNIMQGIKIVNKLAQCYAGIEDQLCNRHSAYLTSMKHRFEQLYNNNAPMNYIIGKGLYEINQQNTGKISLQNASDESGVVMAIQNGVTIAIAKTQLKGNIYINYNRWEELAQTHYKQQQEQQGHGSQQLEEQLILSYKGEMQQQVRLNQNSKQLCKQLVNIYQMAVEDISLAKINGAIIYISSNLMENTFYQKQAILYAFYFAILHINDLLSQYQLEDLCLRMADYYRNNSQLNFSNFDRVSKYAKILQLDNNNILVNSQIQTFNSNNKKLIFAKLNTKTFKKNKLNLIVNQLIQYQNMLITIKEETQNYNMCHRMTEMKKKYQQMKLTQKTNSNFDNLLSKVQKVIQGFLIAESGEYLVLLARHCYCNQIVRTLAKFIKQCANQSQTQQQMQDKSKDILAAKQRKGNKFIGKWNKSKVSQSIFTSLPSLGFCILNPTQQIWFIQ